MNKQILCPSPLLTILLQILGQQYFSIQCLSRCPVHVVVDTQGYPFTYLVFRIGGARVITYTHYPYISPVMLQQVKHRHYSYNNRSIFTNNLLCCYAKYIYYYCLYLGYKSVQYAVDLVLVNSNWTGNIMQEVWGGARHKQHLLYPPCNVEGFQAIQTPNSLRDKLIISFAQFRPEK